MNPVADYLNTLSDEQRQAALKTDNPAIIVAGAGSGKTRTLIGRFLHLAAPRSLGGLGADPSSIMMVTFTNKAAKEMMERIRPVLHDLSMTPGVSLRAGEPWVGTFHSLSMRILRIESQRAELGSNFSIYDEADSESLIKEIVESHTDESLRNQFSKGSFFQNLEFAKAWVLSPEALIARQRELSNHLAAGRKLDAMQERWRLVLTKFEPWFPQAYKEYQDALKSQNAVDFGDLLNRVTTLFRSNPDVRDSWQSTFRHFMIDECQDMNRAQVSWLETMTNGGREMILPEDTGDNEFSSAHHGMHDINGFRVRQFPRPTIGFVGDDDQAIYGFRGSEVKIMRTLDRRFDGLEILYLKESYRCQPNILEVANSLVGLNPDRFGKSLIPANPDRHRTLMQIGRASTPHGEIRGIVSQARKHILAGGDASQFAVLTRTRQQAKEIAKGLRAGGIPVTEGKASDIRKSAEVKDLMAYAGFLVNRDAETLLTRIINKPSRKIGLTSLATIRKNAKMKAISFIDELGSIINNRVDLPDGAEAYKPAFSRACRDFGMLIAEMRKGIYGKKAGEALEYILETSGYLPNLRKDVLQTEKLELPEGDDVRTPFGFMLWLMQERAKKDEQSRAARAGRQPEDKSEDAPEAGSDEHEDMVDQMGRISDDAKRIGNLSILIAQAKAFDSLEDFLQNAMLEMDQGHEAAGIQVMTMHASKGLEFDHVRLPFWNEGVFPSIRKDDDPADATAEERRLAYVSITRGRESVGISWSDAPQVPWLHAARKGKGQFIRDIEECAPKETYAVGSLFEDGNFKAWNGARKLPQPGQGYGNRWQNPGSRAPADNRYQEPKRESEIESGIPF